MCFILTHSTRFDILGLESEVDKLFKILIKTVNTTEYIGSNIQNIKAPRTGDPFIKYIHKIYL